MYYQTTMNQLSPTANIAVNRNRLKLYGEKIYLKDKTNFEIELFNPKAINVLAKIYLDDISISSSGIVLKPGQRVFLERWLDEPRKFLFETYEIENLVEVKDAIRGNGKVKVEFYDQFIPPINGFTIWGPALTYQSPPQPTCGENNVYFTHSTSSDIFGQNSSINTFNSFLPKSFKTGRSEKGEKSNQELKCSNDSFNLWTCNTVHMQILPESKKPVEISEIRNYCTNCGSRHKKLSWKFCPNCGTKI
jgi:hypothetical protein